MKPLTDEEIQKLLDDLKPVESSPEVELYQEIFKELSRSPVVETGNLDKEVVLIVQKQLDYKSSVKTYVAISLCLIVGFFLFAAVSFEINHVFETRFVQLLTNMQYPFIFVAGVLLIISLLERKFFSIQKSNRNQ